MATKKLTATKKFGNKSYKRTSCSKTKLGATQKAKSARKAGKAARVVKNPAGGYCLYTAASKKKVAAKVARPRRRKTSKK